MKLGREYEALVEMSAKAEMKRVGTDNVDDKIKGNEWYRTTDARRNEINN